MSPEYRGVCGCDWSLCQIAIQGHRYLYNENMNMVERG